MFEQSRKLKLQFVGKEHPSYARSLNNVAGVLENQGEYGNALELYEESRALRARLLGEDHPDHGYSLYNLGHLNSKLRNWPAAMQQLKHCIRIWAKIFPAKYPKLVSARRLLAEAQKAVNVIHRKEIDSDKLRKKKKDDRQRKKDQRRRKK